jgi:choice-of-anchor B domain-containing protein
VASTWRDVKVIGNYAYIVSEARNHGLQVFDLTRLRGKTSPETFLPDAVYQGFGNAHNIVANEDTNFVYVVGATQAAISALVPR